MVVDWLLSPSVPGATIGVLLVAMAISLGTSLAHRVLTNREQLDAWRKEIAAWTANAKKGRETGDEKLLAKVKKQEPKILKIQSRMMWQQMKVSIIFFVPIILIWQVLTGFYGESPVAYLPGFGALTVFWWYLICSFTFSTFFSRLLGVGAGATR
jgi:uncharacterized membrane protein (DUF106 family)